MKNKITLYKILWYAEVLLTHFPFKNIVLIFLKNFQKLILKKKLRLHFYVFAVITYTFWHEPPIFGNKT